MRKVTKAILAAVIFVLTLGLLTGCGKPTPASLSKDVVLALAKVKSVDGNVNLEMTGKIKDPSESGLSLDLSVNLDMDYETILKPDNAAHMNMKMNLSLLGMNYDTEVENYTLKGEDGYETYNHIEGTWYKQTVEDSQSETNSLIPTDIFNALKDQKLTAELEDELQKINKKEAYLMHVTLSGDYLESFFSILGDMSDELFKDDTDLENTSVKADIYIYKDVNVPAKIVLDLADLTSSLMPELGTDASAELSKYTLEMTFNAYNTIDKIQVPQEVLDSAEENSGTRDGLDGLFGDTKDESGKDFNFGDSDLEGSDDVGEAPVNEAGNYVITSYAGNLQAEIGVPDNYEYDYSSPNYLGLNMESDDYSSSFDYEFEAFTTMEEMAESYSEYFSYEGDEDYTDLQISPERVTTVNGMEIHYISAQYLYVGSYSCVECYAWTAAPDGTPFVVSLSDFANEGIRARPAESLIQTAFSKVAIKADTTV